VPIVGGEETTYLVAHGAWPGHAATIRT